MAGTPAQATRSGDEATVALQHVAGLASGQAERLKRGRNRITSEQGGIRFELEVRRTGAVVLKPASDHIAVEGRRVTASTPIEQGEVIQVGADHYTVAPVSGADNEIRHAAGVAVRTVDPLDDRRRYHLWWVAVLVTGAGVGLGIALDPAWLVLVGFGLFILLLGLWLDGRRRQRQREQHQTAVTSARKALTDELWSQRLAVARDRRTQHPGPVALFDQASLRQTTGRADSRVAIAEGDVDWNPPVDTPTEAGWAYEPVVAAYSSLSAVPYVIDLAGGPIGVVGDDAAVASVVRYLICASRPDHTVFDLDADTVGPEVGGLSELDVSARAQHETVSLRVCTSRPPSRRDPTIVVAADIDRLPPGPSQVLSIDEAGMASVVTADGEPVATDLVPYGLSRRATALLLGSTDTVVDQHERVAVADLPQDLEPPSDAEGEREQGESVVDATDPSAGMLFTGASLPAANELASTVAVDLALRTAPDDLAIYVLDDGERSLIRLRQLPHCRGYAAIDELAATDEIVSEIEAALGRAEPTLLLTVNGLDRTVDFYGRAGHQELADRLHLLADHMNGGQFVMAASTSSSETLPTDWDQSFSTRVERLDDRSARIESRSGRRDLQITDPSGRDLTASVAQIKRQEAS